MKKLIANGLVKAAEGVEMHASVWVELDAQGAEKKEAGNKYAVLSYKKLNAGAEEMPTDALTFATMTAGLMAAAETKSAKAVKAAAGQYEVPGYAGHENVKLAEPTAVHYSKTKAFLTKDGQKANIYGSLRFNF